MNRPKPTQNTPDSPLSGDEKPAFSVAPYEGERALLRGELFDSQTMTPPPEEPKKRGVGPFFVVVAALFCVYNLGTYTGQKSQKPAPIGPFAAKTEAISPIKVHIVGRVRHAGVFALPGGARIGEAVRQAGALPDADLNALNLADWVADGSKITVPARQKPAPKAAPQATPTPVVIIKEVFVTPPQNAPENSETQAQTLSSESAPPGKSTKTGPKTPRAKTPDSGKSSLAALELLKKNPINLNRATVAQLETLPGIGPAMAARILAYRHENKGIKTIDDLDNVKGIGEKRLEKLRGLVKIN